MGRGRGTRSLVSWYNKGSVARMVTQSVRKSKSDGRNYQCKKKEAGMTSHDVVFKLRKIPRNRRSVMGNVGSRCGRSASDCSWKSDSDEGQFMQDERQGL